MNTATQRTLTISEGGGTVPDGGGATTHAMEEMDEIDSMANATATRLKGLIHTIETETRITISPRLYGKPPTPRLLLPVAAPAAPPTALKSAISASSVASPPASLPPPPPHMAGIRTSLSMPALLSSNLSADYILRPHLPSPLAELAASTVTLGGRGGYDHSRDGSQDVTMGSGATRFRRTIPVAYRISKTIIIQEKMPYYLISAAVSALGSGGWVISTSFSLSGVVTWITVVIFLYLLQLVRQYITIGTPDNAYKPLDISQKKNLDKIIVNAGETVMVQVIPVDVEISTNNVIEFPEYTSVVMIERSDGIYARISNLYRWSKITIYTDPIYKHPLAHIFT